MPESKFAKTQGVVDTMNNLDVSMGMVETYWFLDLFEDEVTDMSAAFDALWPRFRGAYANGNDSWWQNTADHARTILEEEGFIGEQPAAIKDSYAMHFGIPYRLLSEPELAAVRKAIGRFGGRAYCEGDNALEWGEPIAGDGRPGEVYEQVDLDQQIAQQSGHFLVYINKGIAPDVVYPYIEDALPLVRFLPVEPKWAFAGLPFSVDEAECWGENVGTAWHKDSISSDEEIRREQGES